jgi:hypothetical protein
MVSVILFMEPPIKCRGLVVCRDGSGVTGDDDDDDDTISSSLSVLSVFLDIALYEEIDGVQIGARVVSINQREIHCTV